MIESIDALRAAVKAGRTFHYEFFWGHRPSEDGRITHHCLSQWWACRFVVDGVSYTSTEQWMMASKARLFDDAETLAKILAEHDPSAVKRLGRAVRGFDGARWERSRFEIVTRGNIEKFSQDPRLRGHLLDTGDAVLVEASPFDAIWGIGLGADDPRAKDPSQWPGMNLLGFALMRARERLRAGHPSAGM